MTKIDQKILINVEDDETRIALISDSTLDNLYIEQTHRAQKIGNIYCGKVVKVQPSFQAAFIDYGEERHGFLSLSDINFQVYKPNREGHGRHSITQVLKPGQKILVQVIKDEIAHKGASLTTNFSLAGRFLVFMPHSDRGGVSRKIEDEDQRARLRHLLKGLGGEDSSAIIRTVGVDRSLTELKRDFMTLRRTWNEIKDEYEYQSTPGLLYQEENAMVRMIRDYYHENIREVVIDEPVAFQRALKFFQAHMPEDQKKLQLYLGEKSLFSSYEIEGQIEVLHQQQVPLPSGGSLVIIPTEALVAIDVNSGRSSQEKNIEATALRTNLEATEEVAKQLRLRNLGGLIVVDFIDMDDSKNRLTVEQKMEEAMATDKAKISFGEISKFGLLEMSRQRISGSLLRNSIELTLANRILRKIHDSVIEQKVLQVHIRLPLELATHLLNVKRQRLTQIEMDYGISISITPDTFLGPEEIPEMEVTLRGQGGGETRTSVPISASDMRDEKPARKGRSKKEVAKKDISDTTQSGTEQKKESVKGKKTGDASKSLAKRKDKKPGRSLMVKQELPNSDSADKKETEEATVQKEINIHEIDKKKKTNYETSVTKEKTEVLLFESKHEQVKAKNTHKNKELFPEQLAKKNIEPETSTYRSVHLEDRKSSANKTKCVSEDKLQKDSITETPLFSSVHLDEPEKKASKNATSKRETKSLNTSENTKPEPANKSAKTFQQKSNTKKTNSIKVLSKIKPKDSNGETTKSSVKKTKTSKSIGAKKVESKITKSTELLEKKMISSAKPKKDIKNKGKVGNMSKKQKTTKTSTKSTEIKESAS